MFCASFVIKTAFINHQNCCCCCTRKRWSEGRRLPARHHKCFFFSNEDYDDSDTAFCAAACAGWQQQPVLVCRLWQRLANISSYYPHCSCTAELLTVHPAWPRSLAAQKRNLVALLHFSGHHYHQTTMQMIWDSENMCETSIILNMSCFQTTNNVFVSMVNP